MNYHSVNIKRIITLFISLLLCSLSIAQNSPFARGFDKGFKEGYCYNHATVDCLTPLTPLTPLPRLNESNDSYTDGYNRGFQSGLDLQRLQSGLGSANGVPYQNIPNYRFNEYISTIPTEAMVNVGLYKQKLFNERVNWIQKRVYDIQDLAYTLIYQFSTSEYDKYNKDRSDFIDKNLKGKNIDWSDNYMFNQIVSYFNSQERNIYETYSKLISEANSEIIDNKPSCYYYQPPIYVIKKNNTAYFSITQNIKDILTTTDYEFNGVVSNAPEYNGVIVFYLKSKNAYYKMDGHAFYHLSDNSITQMNYVTNCDALFISGTIENSILIIDKGVTQDIKLIGTKTYKTPKNDYCQFSIFQVNTTNKMFFVSKNIMDNPINNYLYPIDSK
jgi:hypothetical protein